MTGERWQITGDWWQGTGDRWKENKLNKNSYRTQFSEEKTFLCGNFRFFMSKNFIIWDHFFPILYSKNSKNLKSLDIGFPEVGTKRLLNGVNKWRKKIVINFFCPINFTPFLSTKVQIWNHFFLLLFPKNSKYLTNLDIGLWEVGAKWPLNGVNKVWRTDKHPKQKQIRNGKILRKKNRKCPFRKLKSLSELTKVAWKW